MDKTHFKVEGLSGDTYQVFEWTEEDDGDGFYWQSVHQGSLSDCESYIRLKEGGYL